MKIDARGWIFQIKDAESGDWLDIGGINTFEEDPSANGETTDTTTFRSQGEYEGEAMQRGGQLTLEGFMAYDDDDETERDAGQAAIDHLGTKKSRESLGDLRFRHDSQPEWINWRAFNEPGSRGGGNNDKTSWSAALSRSGAAWMTDVEDDSDNGGGDGGEGGGN